MRPRHALLIALALMLQPLPAGALGPSPAPAAADPWDVVTAIIDHRNAGELDEAVALAREAFAAAGSDTDLRRTIAREGKDVAVKLLERDRATPKRKEAAISALCWAIETMRIYKAELMTTERDRLTIPAELIRLETLATELAAPCVAKEPESPRGSSAPTTPVESAGPAASGPAVSEGPTPAPRAAMPRRSRARIGIGAGLMASGAGLAAGMIAALVSHRENVDRLDVLAGEASLRDDPTLTPHERADARLWDTRVVRLERTATALGSLAAVSLIAAVIVLVVPPKPVRGARARVQPEGVGFRLAF